MDSITSTYFVFLGESLPQYAISSLELAVRHSGMTINLLGNEKLGRQVTNKNVNFIAVEDFYDSSDFGDAARRISAPQSFRGGFWLKTLERFFVLEQFMNSANLKSIFHAELDQLLFRTDLLVDHLDKTSHKGLFLPFHNKDAAVASVLYCNDHTALESLLDFSRRGESFVNEMYLMASWSARYPQYVLSLPTMVSFLNSRSSTLNPEILALSVQDAGGAVDAAQLGQWIGGIDPRNVPLAQVPSTKFSDLDTRELLSREQLDHLRFELNPSDGTVFVGLVESDLTTRVYNFHLHSKVHKWLLRSEDSIQKLFDLANLKEPLQIPGTRSTQVKYNFTDRVIPLIRDHQAGRRKIFYFLNRKFGRRPGSRPFISGDTFRALADHVWERGNEIEALNHIKAGDVVFCESTEITKFCDEILDKIEVPIVLLLGNSDKNHMKETVDFSHRQNVLGVFAQNLVEHAEGVNPLPIGLENAWYSKNGCTNDFKSRRPTTTDRLPRIMWTFNILTNKTERSKAANSLLTNVLADNLGSLTPRQHQEALSRYCFVAAPPGNGLDTHRAWEAMYLGCIPIVLRSHMTEYYEAIGLPIWVVDSYSEVAKLREVELLEKFTTLSQNFQSEALTFVYWEKMIRDCAKL